MIEIRDLSDMQLCWLLLRWIADSYQGRQRLAKNGTLLLCFLEIVVDREIIYDDYRENVSTLLMEAGRRVLEVREYPRQTQMMLPFKLVAFLPNCALAYVLLDQLSRWYHYELARKGKHSPKGYLSFEAAIFDVAFQLFPIECLSATEFNPSFEEIVSEAERKSRRG